MRVLAALVLVLAGCSSLPAQESPDVADGSGGLFHADWSGSMVAGGGAELPAHFDETDDVARAIWPDVARDLILGNATAMTVRLDWSGTGRVQLMANSPIQDGAWKEHSDPGPQALSSESPLCIQITGDDLVPGGWGIMLHTGAAAGLAYTFNVTVAGEAEGPLPDGAAWGVGAAEFLEAQVEGTMAEASATC